MSWISRAYECQLCMDLPEANSTTVHDSYCLWVASHCVSWSAVAMCALTWVIFVPWASRSCWALAVALHRCDSGLGISHAWNYLRIIGLHEIFKCAYLKLMVYGRKHTHNFHKCSHTSVGLAQARPKSLLHALLYCRIQQGMSGKQF